MRGPPAHLRAPATMPTAQPTGVAPRPSARWRSSSSASPCPSRCCTSSVPPALVTLRLLVAAAVLWPLTRPALRGRARADLWTAIALGVCAGAQTLAFFAAIDRIPLGVAVAIEFLGPLSVGLAGTRRRLDTLWVAAAAAGVALLTLGPGARRARPARPRACRRLGRRLGRLHRAHQARRRALERARGPRRRARRGRRADARAGRRHGGHRADRSAVLAAGAGLALLAPLAPFALEMLALRRLPAGVFGVVMSLEPAIGALLGFALLGQRLGPAAIAAIGLILVASAGATLSSSRRGTSSARANRRPRARRPRRAGAAPARA